MSCARRICAAVLLSVSALSLSGCHKKKVQAYRPPPPPAANYGRYPSSRPTQNSQPATSNVAPLPLPPPASAPRDLGRPISSETGLASWYGPPYAGRKGADGTVYDQNAMTAAHLTLPMGTMVRVTNLTNNQSAIVKITDRGPFVRGRIIDLSLAAAKATGVYRAGVAKVRVEAFASPVRASSTPGGRWCVQIGAFAKESDAVKLKADLMRRYTTAKVIEFPGPTGHWVRINPGVPDRAHATEVADGIHPKDPDALPYLIRTD